jgi:hypothetical protein
LGILNSLRRVKCRNNGPEIGIENNRATLQGFRPRRLTFFRDSSK